jgi:hypothetical protein
VRLNTSHQFTSPNYSYAKFKTVSTNKLSVKEYVKIWIHVDSKDSKISQCEGFQNKRVIPSLKV